jgi:hypothetical protein
MLEKTILEADFWIVTDEDSALEPAFCTANASESTIESIFWTESEDDNVCDPTFRIAKTSEIVSEPLFCMMKLFWLKSVEASVIAETSNFEEIACDPDFWMINLNVFESALPGFLIVQEDDSTLEPTFHIAKLSDNALLLDFRIAKLEDNALEPSGGGINPVAM